MTRAAAKPATHRSTPAVPDAEIELACLKRAVARARLQHKRAGRPIVIWRNGHVVLLPPDQIPDEPGF